MNRCAVCGRPPSDEHCADCHRAYDYLQAQSDRNVGVPSEGVAELRQLRLDRGLTQAIVARKVGIDRSTIGHYETGRAKPSFSTYATWWAALNGGSGRE